jgi:hypothetical protein
VTIRLLLTAAALGFGTAATATTVSVGYDPNAPEGNFSSPTNVNKQTAYNVNTSVQGQNLLVDVQAFGGHDLSGYNFANVYLGGATFSPGLIFEVTNNRVSTTLNPSNYYSLAGTGFSFTDTGSAVAGSLDIGFSLPFSFLENDPLGIGFTKVTPGEVLRISYAQAFGYTFTGGTPLYGSSRLGSFTVPNAAVPEPAAWALMIGGFGFIGGAARRKRAIATELSR